MNTKSANSLVRAALVASFAVFSSFAGAATVNLTAQRMSTTLPDGTTVPMWGYCTPDARGVGTPLRSGAACPATPTAVGLWAPGPTIVVPYTESLTITLTNNLPTPTSLVILGQLGGGLGNPNKMASPPHNPQTQTTWPGNGTPDVTFTPPAQSVGRVMSFATEAGAGAQTTLTWDAQALKPGTYIYETGTLPSIQAPMGLYGVLIVTKAPVASPFAAGDAYPTAPGKVMYDSDTSLLFSEIDPVQNAAVDRAAAAGTALTKRFDDPSCVPNCYPAAVNYTPTYFLINGQAYDRTAPNKSAFALANTASPTGNVLVRLLNAGLRTHIPSIVGLPMSIVAEDGNLAPGNPKKQNEVLLTAGKTHDVLIPAAGAYANKTFPLFDRQLSLSTANTPDGGMQGFLQMGTGVLPAAVTPQVIDDAFQIPLNASINGNVKLNDIAAADVAVVVGPNKGVVDLHADGTFVYTANAGATGNDTFTYKASNTANTATVTLSIAATGLGAAPIAGNDSYTGALATTFSTARPGVLANDRDPTGYPLTAVKINNGSCGSVNLNQDGSFTAAPNGPATSCQFTYRAKNSQGTQSSSATVNVAFGAAGSKTGLNVAVLDVVTGVAISDYRWIIQEDLTFKVDPTATPSLATRTLGTSFHRSHMPVVASGCVGPISCGSGQAGRIDSATVDAVTKTLGARHILTDAEAIALQTLPSQVALDPAKHYYISILPGDAGNGGGDDTVVPVVRPGHAMGGADINPQVAGAWKPVTIKSSAYPLIPAQLSIYIYEDNGPVNGQNDLNETGLGGFNIIVVDAVGRSGDPAGQQTFDASGMPLSNWLLGRPGCADDRNTLTNGTTASTVGNIVGVVYTCPNAPNPLPAGRTAADYSLAGHALIKNITPARYDVIAHPAAERQGAGEVWFQTETLEGTQAQDAFAGKREPVYFQEFGPPGFHTTIGFVNPAHVAAQGAALMPTGAPTYTVSGTITNQRMSRPSNTALLDSGSYDLLSSTTCLVAVNSQGGAGPAIAMAQCDHDTGNFTLSGIPAGSYEIAIWDQWLDQIIQTKAVTITNANVAMGNIPVLSWFTQYDQNIFQDLNKNGVYDAGEPGISNVTMTTRYRDGGISNQTATDSNGNGLLAELFPLFNWYVTEADTTRFKQTGVNVIVDGGGPTDTVGPGAGLYTSTYPTGGTSNRVEIPGAYSYGLQGFISQRNTINWGRTPYVTGENGGIQGTVVYSTTRPFDDQRYNVQTLWEPLVPRVTVNLYHKEKLADGTDALTLVDTAKTSSFDDWVNAVQGSDGATYLLGQDGVLREPSTGQAAASTVTAGKQVNLQCPGQLTTDPFYVYTLNGTDQGRCYDGWHNWNQVESAPYDGRYAFPSADYIAKHALTPAQIAAGQTLVSLPPGQYVVETVTPPGYDVVKEEDKNILNGDAFDSPVPPQFGGLGNIFILPDQATLNNANPYNLRNADGVQNNATSNLGVTASSLKFPECVGNLHRVPDYLSLYPQGGLVAPFAGMDRPLCDRKLVNLNDQQQASATFFVFTSVPTAAAGTGIILDDASSEFNAAAPDFGEKASVPFVPVSIKDFNGVEVTRTYSDQWGAYNVLTPSSWLVNPPTPSGYGPNMLVTCINDPGPIAATNALGQWINADGVVVSSPLLAKQITDPQYNAAYSNFCYTLPYMPGRTTYLDTPVLPIAAFAGGYNPADCFFPDATPAIARVDSSAGFGPYLPASGGTLTIKALGDVDVPNPSYAGPFAVNTPASLRTIKRHYGFGDVRGVGTVSIGNTILTTAQITGWNDSTITVNVPAGVRGQLTITAGNGRTSIDTVTVTAEVATPKRVPSPAFQTIQSAIDAATPGDLILVDAGTYNELVIMWKPVRIQGVGASSVIINATKYPTSKLATWRPMVNAMFGIDTATGNPAAVAQVDPLPGQEITGGIVLLEPSVLGSEEGAGITVLAKGFRADGVTRLTNSPSDCAYNATSVVFDLDNGANTVPQPGLSNFLCHNSRIDGVSVTGGDAGGGIFVNGWAHNLEIANNRVYGNAGAFHGGVRIGVPYLENLAFPGLSENADGTVVGTPSVSGDVINGWGFDRNVKIHHNTITKNGVVEGPAGGGGAGGGVSICSGTDGYSVDHNWVCGNVSSSDGGGIGHIGFSQGGTIAFNTVLFNQSFQQTSSTHGGGIAVIGEPPLFGATVSPGTGNLTIDGNVIRGNFAEAGHGGGIRLQQVNGGDVAAFSRNTNRWHKVTVTNNIVDNNVSGWGGGGMSLSDSINSVVVNNTIASNDSVGIAGSLLVNTQGAPVRGSPNPAGFSSDPTSAQLTAVLPVSQRAANAISKPTVFSNNIVWHNRAFNFDTTIAGVGRLCNTNAGAGTGATCRLLTDQATTGACPAGAVYWDIGQLGDTGVAGATGAGSANHRLNPTFSVLSSTAGYTGTGNSSGDPLLADAYCNGSRVTPEFPGVINPPSVKNLQVAATLDEGNNYVNMRYGPLSLVKPATPAGNAFVLFGDYHLAGQSGSAYNNGTDLNVPNHDVDNQFRPQGGSRFDIGADEVFTGVVAPAAHAVLSPASHDYGNVVVGGTSSSFAFTLSNTGNAQLTGIAVSFSGSFARRTVGGTCGASLNAGANCTINVVFRPTATGAVIGTLSVANSDVFTSPQTASLTGTGVPSVAQALLTPTSWNAGTVTRGAGAGILCLGANVGPCQLFVLSNPGTAPLTNIAKALSGSNDYSFVPALSTCGTGNLLVQTTTLAPGAFCIMTVQFRPKATDAANSLQTANLTVTDSLAPPQTAALTGVAR